MEWRKCSTCKQSIEAGKAYYVCSVSTCNGQRTGYVFCRMQCFEAHLPGARHRDAAAIEMQAPKNGVITPPANPGPQRFIAKNQAVTSSIAKSTEIPKEVLIIASRLKDYVQARADMNTSASVIDVLSNYVRILCDRGADNARADGRKTLMDRDFEFLKKL
jgi:histone H3/H4